MTADLDSPPRLAPGASVPPFVLQAAGGQRSGPGAVRSKYNLVLVFLNGRPGSEQVLQSLALSYQEILDEQARVIAVVDLPAAAVETLAGQLRLPFTLLSDEGGEVTRRMLGPGNTNGLCVADRYAQIFYVDTAPQPEDLPGIQSALEWLAFIQVQCPE